MAKKKKEKKKKEETVELIGYSEASRLLGIPVATLYNWVSLKRIPHIRMSKRMVRFDPERIRRWIEERVVEEGDANR